MVTIKYKNNKISSILFCELPVGQFFMVNKTVYEKVFDVSTMLNALDVSTGKLVHIDNDVEVVKLTAEITVEKEDTDDVKKLNEKTKKESENPDAIRLRELRKRAKDRAFDELDYIELFLENFT